MKKIKITITGCLGRMGQQIIKSSLKDSNFKIVSLTESKLINRKINGIKIETNNFEAINRSDVIIDFSTPKCTLEILRLAFKSKKRVVI